MSKKDPASPATTSHAYDYMAPKWARVETLLGGTDDMRAAGQEYLPAHPEESDDNYRRRLAGAVLYNMTSLTLESLVGKPFSKQMAVGEGTPDAVRAILEDVDLQGDDLTRFCRGWFAEGLAKGYADVLVDMPGLSGDDRAGRTLADDARDRRRPYWVLLKPENVIFRSSTIVNGEERYTEVRIREYPVYRDGFTEVVKPQILVLHPDDWWRYEEVVDPRTKRVTWRVVDFGANDLGFVPLVTFYAGKRQALGIAKPPMEDIAQLNVTHWQSSADQRDILTVCRFPMLGAAGVTETMGKKLRVGPHQVYMAKDPAAKYYFIEHTGKAVDAGRQDILDLEEQMASYGAEFLKRRPGNATATARTLNTAEATSPLQDMATQFDDAVATAMWVTAQWLGLGEDDAAGGSAETTKDFGLDEVSEAQLKTLMDARKNGDISRETFVMRMRDFGILGEDFDAKKDDAMLLAEMALLDKRAETNRAITGRPDPNPGGVNNGAHRPSMNGGNDAGA